jgi:hypothetical protein
MPGARLSMLEALDRLLPNLRGYALWARALFVAAIVLALGSAGAYAAYFNAATREQDAAHISIDVTPSVLTEKAATNAATVGAQPRSKDAFDAGLEYVDVRTGGHAHFVPQQDYLATFRAGGPVKALSGLSPQAWRAAARPAVLDVKVANDTRRTVFFTEAILDVQRSAPDRRPVLVPTVLLDRTRRLTIVNYGWGPAEDVRVKVRVPVAGRPDGDPTTIRLGTVEQQSEVDLSKAFGAAGLDVEALRSWEASTRSASLDAASYQRGVQRAREVLAPFGLDPERGVELPVEGELQYRIGAESPAVPLRFTAAVPATRQLGLGDFQPVTARYRTTKLAIAASSYQRRVPLSQRVRPGETDRFEIPVSAAESSKHVFRVRLVYGPKDGIVSGPISLDLLVPRHPR